MGVPINFVCSSPRSMSAILRGAVAIRHTIVLGFARPSSWRLYFGFWFLGVVQGALVDAYLLGSVVPS